MNVYVYRCYVHNVGTEILWDIKKGQLRKVMNPEENY